jgi:hypothetical protein
MRQFFPAVCFFLALFALPKTQAQAEPVPVIAVSEGAIYAINAGDGSAEMLVPAPHAYDEMLEFVYRPITLTSAEWLSPDGRYLAYRVLFPTNPDEEIDDNTDFTQRLFLLDFENPNRPISLSFAAERSNIESVAWSFDSSLLYVLVNDSLRIIERDNWTAEITVDVGDAHSSQNPVLSRRVFATESGVVMADGGDYSVEIDFTLFDNEGNQLNYFVVDYTLSPDVNLFLNTPFTPIEPDGKVQYPFTDFYGQLLFVTDFATGESSEGDYSRPAMLSRNAIDSSLRLFPSLYSGDYMILTIIDSEDNYLDDIVEVSAYAYGVSGYGIGSTFALSPDGQQLAYLEDENLMLWENGEARSLDFAASVIVWSAPIYLPFSPDYFRG